MEIRKIMYIHNIKRIVYLVSKFVLTAAHCFDDNDYPKNDKNKQGPKLFQKLDKNVLG